MPMRLTKEWTLLDAATHPAKNMSRNQDPGTANSRIASSVLWSPFMRKGMHSRIMKLDTRKMALAGALPSCLRKDESPWFLISPPCCSSR